MALRAYLHDLELSLDLVIVAELLDFAPQVLNLVGLQHQSQSIDTCAAHRLDTHMAGRVFRRLVDFPLQ